MSDLPERFYTKVQILSSGCWLWTASKGPQGYGYFRWEGRMRGAHRVAYQVANDRVLSSNEVLDHFKFPEQGCIGPSCANPDHVRVVTRRENTLRGDTIYAWNLAKEVCPAGHLYDEKNTLWFNYHGRGDNRYRKCRTCNTEKARLWREARRAEK